MLHYQKYHALTCCVSTCFNGQPLRRAVMCDSVKCKFASSKLWYIPSKTDNKTQHQFKNSLEEFNDVTYELFNDLFL